MHKVQDQSDQRLIRHDVESSTSYVELPERSNAPVYQPHPAFSASYPINYYPAQPVQRQFNPTPATPQNDVPQEPIVQATHLYQAPPQRVAPQMLSIPVSAIADGQPYSLCIRNGQIYFNAIAPAPYAPQVPSAPCKFSCGWFNEQNEKLKDKTSTPHRFYLLGSTLLAILFLLVNLFYFIFSGGIDSISIWIAVILNFVIIQVNLNEMATLCGKAEPMNSCKSVMFYLFQVLSLVIFIADLSGRWRLRTIKEINLWIAAVFFIVQLVMLVVDRNTLRSKLAEQRANSQ